MSQIPTFVINTSYVKSRDHKSDSWLKYDLMQIWERLEHIRVFEKQSGLSRLLIFLFLEGASNISRMIDTANIQPNVDYSAVKKATDLELITSDYGEVSNYLVRRLELTEKGRSVAEHLIEVNDILSS